MLRNLAIFFVLLVHVNGSMLMPQNAEQDIYNADGQQQKDINTVAEYVYEVLLDSHDKSPVDQDNDQGQNFHLVNVTDYYFVPDFLPVRERPSPSEPKKLFALLPAEIVNAVTLDVVAPPPKA